MRKRFTCALASLTMMGALAGCQRSPRHEAGRPELAQARPGGGAAVPAPPAPTDSQGHVRTAETPAPVAPVAPPPAPGPPRTRKSHARIRDLQDPFADDADLLTPGSRARSGDTTIENPFGNPPPTPQPRATRRRPRHQRGAQGVLDPNDLRDPFAQH